MPLAWDMGEDGEVSAAGALELAEAHQPERAREEVVVWNPGRSPQTLMPRSFSHGSVTTAAQSSASKLPLLRPRAQVGCRHAARTLHCRHRSREL
jgi:hypothetical protein